MAEVLRETGRILGRAIGSAFSKLYENVFSLSRERAKLIPEVEAEIAGRTLDEKKFQSPEVKKIVRALKEAMKSSPRSVSELASDLIADPLGALHETIMDLLIPVKPKTPEEARTDAGRLLLIGRDMCILIGCLDIISTACTATLVRNVVHIARLYISTFGLDRLVSSTMGPGVTSGLIRPLEQYYGSKYLTSIPGPSDMIRMMVREVFTPEIREKYGQDQEYPEEATRLLGLHGYSEYWARNYWAAHWELPSLSQGFEMYHRGLISWDELMTLMRTLDIMPYWREKLVGITYALIPRVDLRRGWELGVFSADELQRRFRKLGFDPDDSLLMARVAIREALEAEIKALERNTMVRFKEGYITRDQAIEELKALGWAPERIEILTNQMILEEETELKQMAEKYLIDAYVKDVIPTPEELDGLLSGIIVNPEIRKWKIALADLRKYKKPASAISIKVE